MRRLTSLFMILSFFLGARAIAAPPDENLVRLYMLPSYPQRINWNSPLQLLTSTLWGLVVNGAVSFGHVAVELQCAGEAPVLVGAMEKSASSSGKLLLSRQVGFALLESGWEGKLQTSTETLQLLRGRSGNPDKLGIVTYLVSPENCRRLTRYYKQYSSLYDQGPMYYGFGPRPLRKEGSGCTAFGASFVEVAGFMTNELRGAWTTLRRIPLSLVAGHGRTHVSVFDLLTSREAGAWSDPRAPHMALEFFDPDKMYEWVRARAASPELLRAEDGSLDTSLPHALANVPAIVFDRRRDGAPEGPIFQGEPSLVPATDISKVRGDRVYAPNGSFEVRP